MSKGKRSNARTNVNGPYAVKGKAGEIVGWKIVIRYPPGPDGARAQNTRTYKTRGAAKAAIDRARRQISEAVTVESLLPAFRAFIAERNRSKREPALVETRLRAFFGEAIADDIESFDVKRIAALYDEQVKRYATETQRTALKRVRQFFKWCNTQPGINVGNPAKQIEVRGVRSPGKEQLRPHELRALHDLCFEIARDASDPNAIAALAVLVTYGCGLRRSELLGITVRDVEPNGSSFVCGTKTESSRRTAYVPPHIAPLVAARRASLDVGRLFPYSGRWLGRNLHALCDRAGVPRVCPHSLRGSFSSTLADAALPANLIAVAMGHSSAVVTKKHYIDRDAAERGAAKARARALR